jgi:hypothetical protein
MRRAGAEGVVASFPRSGQVPPGVLQNGLNPLMH